jgi:hypothetical protein
MKENRFWFYFGLAILAPTWGYFILGFLAIITFGVILIPLVALVYGAPFIGLQYLVWKRPRLTIIVCALVSFLAVLFWLETENESEPYWRLVRNKVDGSREFCLVESDCGRMEASRNSIG